MNGYKINMSSRDFIMLNYETLTQQLRKEMLYDIKHKKFGGYGCTATGMRLHSAEKITEKIYNEIGFIISYHTLASIIDGGLSDKDIENKIMENNNDNK
jgi:hypothetical protein